MMSKYARPATKTTIMILVFAFLAGFILASEAQAQTEPEQKNKPALNKIKGSKALSDNKNVSPSVPAGIIRIYTQTSDGSPWETYSARWTDDSDFEGTNSTFRVFQSSPYVVHYVQPGNYALYVFPLYNFVSSVSPAGLQQINSVETTSLTVTLTPAGTVRVVTKTPDYSALPADAGFTFSQEPGSLIGATYPDGTSYRNEFKKLTTALGDYQVTANPAPPGWDVSVSPSTTQELLQGETETFTVTYTRKTGRLKLNVFNADPDYDIPAGAGWTITKDSDDYSGQATGAEGFDNLAAETGTYSIEINDLGEKWFADIRISSSQNQNPYVPGQLSASGELVEGETLELSITYKRYTRSFNNFNFNQPATFVLPDSAGIKITEAPEDYEGPFEGNVLQTILPTGTYVIEPRTVPGWRFRLSMISGVSAEEESTDTRLVINFGIGGSPLVVRNMCNRDTGELTVNLTANGSGATYGISGPSDYGLPEDFTDSTGQQNNFNDTAFPTGSYIVTFDDVPGYKFDLTTQLATPNGGTKFTQGFTSEGKIETGEAHSIEAVFTRTTGSLKIVVVNGSTGYTLPATAGWRITDKPEDFSGTNTDGDHNGLEISAETGEYTVAGKDISGWDWNVSVSGPVSPAASETEGTVDVEKATTYTVRYTRNEGRIKVNLVGSDGKGSFDISGPTVIGSASDFSDIAGRKSNFNQFIPTGNYSVQFADIPGYSLQVTTSFEYASAASPAEDVSFAQTNPSTGSVNSHLIQIVTGTYSLKTGSLTVKIATNPNHDETNSDAHWTLSAISTESGNTFTAVNDKGTNKTIDDLPLGTYQVVYGDVDGWQTPAADTVIVQEAAPAPASATDGNDASVTGTYVLKTGTLTVNVATNPNHAPANNTATWTVSADSTVSGVSFSNTSGTGTITLNDLPLGTYKVKFNDLTGWDKPGNKTVEVQAPPANSPGPSNVSEGNAASVTGTYVLIVGSLTVNVATDPNYNPQNINATWTLSQTSSVSGVSFTSTTGTGTEAFSDVPLGTYKVVFDDAAGWQTPVSETVNIEESSSSAPAVGPASASSGIEASATGTYILKVGTLTVNIASDPNWDATNNGATWTLSQSSTVSGVSFSTIQGTGTQSSSDVPLGTYEVVYNDLAGWVTPGSDTVVVEESSAAPADASDGNAASTIGTYSLVIGELTVSITTSLPSPTIPGSAAWRLSGTTLGGPSFSTSGNGSSTPTIPTGDYTISYSDITGWDTPANDLFTLATTGETVTGHYIRHLGSLLVTIIPDAAIAGGAQWRTNPNQGWRASGSTAIGIPTGIVYIELSGASDYFTPASVQVQISKDSLQTVVVSYNKDLTGTGNLQINIDGVNAGDGVSAPASATDQPQWRFVDTDTWYDSGTIIANIANGDYDIEFSLLQGYLPPSQSNVNVRPGIENNVAAEYLRPLIVHRSDYDGDGTEDLAIHDAATRTWSIASSGKNKTSTSASLILEKKFGTKESIPTPGDYDGDGYADLAYYLQARGEWKVNKQFKLKGFGQAGDIPVPGDYNGDGRTDPALYRPSTGEWLIHDLDRDKTMMVPFGSNTELPVPGNYDGDAAGMTDLAVYDVATGKWRVAIYNAKKNKWVNKKKLGATFGAVGEMPVQADYDGDGKTDIAVYNRELSLWKVKGQFELELGIEGDVPVPNDWAGLGRAIPAVFRVKTGAWIALDNLLNTRFGAGGQPLVSGK